ncbi:uncharacterized protein LOC135496056 [Lineus longissimus]|uniref:uncharacterized protein LOC135496056 n=1 Tax=Lineus longissimus TaxID=88925 RepID=UPI002B4F099E
MMRPAGEPGLGPSPSCGHGASSGGDSASLFQTGDAATGARLMRDEQNSRIQGQEKHGTPSRQAAGNASFENHLSKQNVEYKVILQFDDSYLKTGPGIIKFILTLLSVISLICVTSSGTYLGSYLLLPMDWHLRAFVFTAVGCFLTSLLFLTIQITGLIKMFQFNWHFVDLAVFSWFTFLYLFSSSLVASAVVYYKSIEVKPWTIEQLIIACVLGFMCMVFCGLLALNGYRKWHGSSQFRRFRLQELERLDRLYNLENV